MKILFTVFLLSHAYYLTITMILSKTLSISNKSNENGNLGHLGNNSDCYCYVLLKTHSQTLDTLAK